MKVLFLTHRVPYAPNRGDRIRAWHLLRSMSGYANVSLFALSHDAGEAARLGDVPGTVAAETVVIPKLGKYLRGLAQLPGSRPLTHALLDAPGARAAIQSLVDAHPPDVVLAYCSGMARFALEPPLTRVPYVLDMVDVDSHKWRGMSTKTALPMSWVYQREARTLSAFEKIASERACAVLVVNDRERDAVTAIAPGADVHVIPVGIDLPAYQPPAPPAPSDTVVFCGMMDYPPNVEAAIWFARDIWPLVRRDYAAARFTIVGANPPARVRALASDPSIVVTGRVDQVQPYLWSAALSVAPVRLARGLQNKVMEALAAGLPTVVTTAVHEGLPAGIDRGCLVADDEAAFAAAVVGLLRLSPEDRRALADASDVRRFDWPVQLLPVRSILEHAAGRVGSEQGRSRVGAG
ncbi:MAG TPA: TIGR03087 family PEP-CTERM/XrtA system glycosyltransferase, partial [Vicinamibacterales bacterium]|nr:TIGR03087 family PEP-CTERM/XrtA system glycosyltransferase [Vicinamibacterales bacterium]